jgi:hypothetical protein
MVLRGTCSSGFHTGLFPALRVLPQANWAFFFSRKAFYPFMTVGMFKTGRKSLFSISSPFSTGWFLERLRTFLACDMALPLREASKPANESDSSQSLSREDPVYKAACQRPGSVKPVACKYHFLASIFLTIEASL